MAAAQEIRGQGRGCGGKSRERHEGETHHCAQHIRHGQFTLAKAFDRDEEQEPSDERKKTLHHHPKAHIEHFRQQTKFEFRQTMESKTMIVYFEKSVDDEKEHRDAARNRRSDGGTGNTERRETKVAEHQHVVEHHIRQHHHNSIVFEHLGLCRADKEGAKKTSHHAEVHAPHAPIQIKPSGMIHVVRRDEQTQQSGAKILSTDEQNGGKRGEEEQAVPKHAADIFWLVLPIAAPHENLRTGTKSEDEHKHCDEEDTSECRGS